MTTLNNGVATKPGYDRRAVFAWCMYDFANSPFTTLVVTFIYATFFTKVIASDGITGTLLWSRGVTITAITVALLSPILGAIADRSGKRKRYLGIMTAVSVIGTAMLYTVKPGNPMPALVWFVTANIMYELACVFYNAFLPDIAPQEKIGRISGYGWAIGYAGGLAAMFIALIGFINPEQPWFGFSTEDGENIRATNLLVAVWFVIFAIPTFLWVPEQKKKFTEPISQLVSSSFKQLVVTFHEIKRYRQIVRLLLARLFYNDGLITIFAFAGIYASETFSFTIQEIMLLGITLNITAGLGAFAMGYLDDRLGGKQTIQISLVGLFIATLVAVCAWDKPMIWLAGILAGIFSGPNQSASRSLMGRFVPEEKENEFYGFFAFSGKATAFMGPFLFGTLTSLFSTQRAGVAAVLFFFIIGGIIMHTVDEPEGIALSGRQKTE